MSATAEETIRIAQEAFVLSPDPAVIKDGTDTIRSALAVWQTQSKAVEQTLRTFLQAMQEMCKHPNAKRGYNERDGSWMNPCPTCGKAE